MEEEVVNEITYQFKKMKLKIKLLYGLIVILSLFGAGISILLFTLLYQ